MEGLLEVLDRMQEVCEEGYRHTHHITREETGKLVTMRQELNDVFGEFITVLACDRRMAMAPELLAELQAMLDELRELVKAHRAKWQTAEIFADKAGYRAATDKLHSIFIDFIEKSRGKVHQFMWEHEAQSA